MKARPANFTAFAVFATVALAASLALSSLPARAAGTGGFSMEVLVDGSPLPELYGRGQVYVEALRERPYAIRITNPLGVRVAVALAVDGRNTIDAKRTTASGASKWVLEPYESTVISGWQVDGATARRFTFTTERKSYAAFLGDLSNVGAIEAVFYRERVPLPPPPPPRPYLQRDEWNGASRAPAAGAPSEPAPAIAESAPKSKGEAKRAEHAYEADASDSAATGMGDPTRHDVTQVAIDLESRPAAQVRIRYEYRPQLVSLGILPRDGYGPSRRERATGFSSYCPQPPM